MQRMILSEAEAATKWCPMIRADVNTRPSGESNIHFCLGSKCMSWVWYDPHKTIGLCGFTNAKQESP